MTGNQPQKNLLLPAVLVLCLLLLTREEKSIASISQALIVSSGMATDMAAPFSPCNCSSNHGDNSRGDSSDNGGMKQPLPSVKSFPAEAEAATTMTMPPRTNYTNLPVNILFALVGDHPGFIAEFEVALKSILLNFPLHSPNLDVHILLDNAAHQAVLPLLSNNHTQLNQSSWPLPISIHLYPVQSYHQQWTKRIRQTVGRINTQTHTIGTYYRLFAHEILSPDVGPVLYLDTDVLILASLDALWQHVNISQMYQWAGKQGRIAGFMILNLDLFRRWDFWKMVSDMNQNFTKLNADQGILRAVQDFNPNCCGWIPDDAWGLHKEFIWRHLKRRATFDYFVSQVPRAGMLHINGGGESKESYFKDLPKEHFGIVQYYVDLRWPWVRYFGESRTGPLGGYKLQLVDHQI